MTLNWMKNLAYLEIKLGSIIIASLLTTHKSFIELGVDDLAEHSSDKKTSNTASNTMHFSSQQSSIKVPTTYSAGASQVQETSTQRISTSSVFHGAKLSTRLQSNIPTSFSTYHETSTTIEKLLPEQESSTQEISNLMTTRGIMK